MASRSPRRAGTSTRPARGKLIVPDKKIRLPDVRPLRAGQLFGLADNPKPCGPGNIVTLDADESRYVVAAGGRIHAMEGSVRAQTSVAYEEYVGSPRFSGTGAELTAQSEWRVNWSDIETLYLILFPGPIGNTPQLPMLMPNSLVLRASQVDFEPEFDEALIVANDGNNRYDKAKVTITWKTTPFSEEGQQILTRRISVSGEFLTLPSSGLRWKNAGGPSGNRLVNDDLQAGRVIPIIEHHLTLHRVPAVPYAAIRSLIGHVNSVAFEGAAVATVLFAGAELQQTITADGSQPWQIEMHFDEKIITQGGESVGWNHYFRIGTGEWEEMETESGDTIYPTGNLNALI